MISGRGRRWALAALWICVCQTGFADTSTVVLRPVTTPKVKARYRERAAQSIAQALASQRGVTLAAEDPEFTTSGNECAADASCLATMGRLMGADRVVGVLLLPQGGDYTLVLILADVRTEKVLAKQALPIAHKKLDKDPGAALLEFLAAAPAPELPEAKVEPPPEPVSVAKTVAPRPPAGPPAKEGVPLAAPSPPPHRESALELRRTASPPPAGLAIGMHSGGYFPRGDLVAGVLLGLDVRASAPGLSWLSLHGGVDWVLVHEQDSPLVGPPLYPRSRVQLIQKSQIYTLYAGADVTVARAGFVELYGGAALGLAISRSSFDAYGRTQAENDANAIGLVELGARTIVGPLRLGISVSLRETRHDLNDAGTFGEDNLSGFLLTATGAYIL